MIEQAQALGRTFGMVHNFLYFPEYRLIRELIDQGEVGELHHIAINLLGVPDDPGNEQYRPRWRHDVDAAGGGVLMDLIHVFYLAEFLMNSQISGVSAVVDNFGSPEEQIEDFVLAHLYFPKGYASVNVSWSQGPGGWKLPDRAAGYSLFTRISKPGHFRRSMR